MSSHFYYDGQGKIVDEQGNDAMGWENNVRLQIQLSCRERIKFFNAINSGRLAGSIAGRTVQKWTKRLKEEKDWNIFRKADKLGE
ncbi:hypothetical protein BCV72DRAFT_302843 [Rhizopus microsporus var. microsporus]|uniref:Uncharacterized protein n=2 Tax=Rhizopus microsporus TaxID=58291 RepID=A0A2G4T0D9_RHIZD|nr:uncharacterized protein RHIMIDRAFT_290188 [Rhizopus microsporus ATCC 52813]ORE09429.1 hypothetical protein BCV72DRAFT_302843 [Rhizopus microsporus var. microsporus]PHZ14457.1 hypothetical protein RHIMIDRAFT_290188 [Rhizopus microsporus ATCC 52813]